jgi:hypothetical protein
VLDPVLELALPLPAEPSPYALSKIEIVGSVVSVFEFSPYAALRIVVIGSNGAVSLLA